MFHRYYLYNIYKNTHFILDNSKLAIIALTCFFITLKAFSIKIKKDLFLDYSYKCGILEKGKNKKNEENLLYYEMDILCSSGFNKSQYELNYTNSYNIFQNVFKSLKIEIKNVSLSQKVKQYFLSLIQLSFIFPFFLNYSPKIIILGCANIFLKKNFPNRKIQIWNIKEYSDIRTEIINFSDLFEKIFARQRETINSGGNLENDFNNINNTHFSIDEENEINFEIIRTINTNG